MGLWGTAIHTAGARSGALAAAILLTFIGMTVPADAHDMLPMPLPHVVRVSPHATAPSLQPTLLIDFSVPMAPQSVAVRLEPAASFWWYWDDPGQLVVLPKMPLRPGTRYTVRLSGWSLYGGPLVGQTVYSFTTPLPADFPEAPHVLMYHINGSPRPGEIAQNFVSWDALAAQLDELTALGYRFGTLDSGCSGRTICITFDDGWATQLGAAQLLAARGIPATFFITVDLIDRPAFMSAGEVRALSDMGMTIGSHLLDHVCLTDTVHRLPVAQQRSYLEAQIGRSQQRLRDLTGQPVRYLAYPYGCFDFQVIQVARRYYDAAWTTERSMPLAPGMSPWARRRLAVLESTHFTDPPAE